MCLACSTRVDGLASVRRKRILELLALVEHRDALPGETALRLAREILMLAKIGGTGLRCTALPSSEQ